ncbi:hypothetical protein CCACVL1_12984 [Corchorus capsularis]|uniref:Uncharacterized protein n=1 Tax=Corchorus capsularis TaxID=210143 RepID=A0A1R3ID26_COCAP|nr:hypothetical protein CCACVL1_12984 [Corchorus capsularis]
MARVLSGSGAKACSRGTPYATCIPFPTANPSPIPNCPIYKRGCEHQN